MDCPACDRSLTRAEAADLEVDVCRDGCGGVWFDAFELEKVDERHESAGTALLDVEREPDVAVDRDRPRDCPSCGEAVMHRHFFTVKREVEVDECPACAGVWLDAGELGAVRRQFEDESAREEAAAEEYRRLFGEEMAKMREASREGVERSRSLARTFRFVLPSHWIPGDQDWGSF